MNDTERWNKSIADAAKVRSLMQEDGRTNGAEVINEYLLERMENARAIMVNSDKPLPLDEYQEWFYEYKAYKNLYAYLNVAAERKAENAKAKLDEYEAINAGQ